MDFHDIAWYIAGFLWFLLYIPYIISIFNGKTRPNLAGWLLYEVAMVLIVISSWKLGVSTTLYPAIVNCIMQFIIILLCFRFGFVRFTYFDIVFFTISGVSIILWKYTDNAFTALILNIIVDASGSASIAHKIWKNPGTETPITWTIALMSGIINTFAITSFTPEQYILPTYIILANLIILILALRKTK